MKKIFFKTTVVISLFFAGCSSSEDSFDVTLINSLDNKRIDEYVTLNLDSIKNNYNDFDTEALTIYEGGKEIPFQLENDEEKKNISFVIDFSPSEKKIVNLHFEGKNRKHYKSRVFAEVAMKVDYKFINEKYSGGKFQNYDSLRVPDGHTDHNALFKYEGPGWESDKVGYRYYIDWRNRIDIFGKTTNDLVLKNVGINDLEAKDDSYHKMQDWGMDIFQVGNSLGIGSYGMMLNDSVYMVSDRDSIFCKITDNGPIKAEIETDFYGWKVEDEKFNLKSLLSINAGSRLTKTELTINNNPDNIVTGLAKHDSAGFFENTISNKWSYIALYGNQTLAGDKLGIALFYNEDKLKEVKETEDSYVLILKPENGKISYYFCAAWENEPEGIKTKEEFISYLNDTLFKLNNPVSVEY